MFRYPYVALTALTISSSAFAEMEPMYPEVATVALLDSIENECLSFIPVEFKNFLRWGSQSFSLETIIAARKSESYESEYQDTLKELRRHKPLKGEEWTRTECFELIAPFQNEIKMDEERARQSK